MIRRIKENHLTNVSGGKRPKCICGISICSCSDEYDAYTDSESNYVEKVTALKKLM